MAIYRDKEIQCEKCKTIYESYLIMIKICLFFAIAPHHITSVAVYKKTILMV